MSLIAKKRIQSKTKKICSECGTSTIPSYAHWCSDGKGGWLCKRCYDRVYFRERASLFIFDYKGKSFWDKQKRRLRTGICAFCGAKSGDINPKSGRPIRTNRAHIEYHDDDPLKDVIELCLSCHTKYDRGIPPDRRCCVCGSNRTLMEKHKGYEEPYAKWYKGPVKGQFKCR